MTARAVNERLPAVTCAYEPCQAGGVILAGCPRVTGDLRYTAGTGEYHPGCWAAEQHKRAMTNGAR